LKEAPVRGRRWGMNGLARNGTGRVVTRGRGFERHLQEALDTECVECAGTLHVWRSEHKNLEGRPSLHQAVVCLHCNLRYVRVLMVPQPNALVETLAGLALLVFSSLRVGVVRAVRVLSPARW